MYSADMSRPDDLDHLPQPDYRGDRDRRYHDDDRRSDSGYRLRRRYGPRFPFWLLFPLMFFMFRPYAITWGPGGNPSAALAPLAPLAPLYALLFAVLPLAILGIIALRILGPMIANLAEPTLQRLRPRAPNEMADQRRLELDLLAAHRHIRDLEAKLEWQAKLLESSGHKPPDA